MTDRLTDAELEAMRGHTPGPWSIPHFAEPEVGCECEYLLSDTCLGAVASVHCSGEGNWLETGDNPKFAEAVANARLFHAAPNLLAELIERRAMDAKRNDLLHSIRLRATLAEADGAHMRGALRNIVEQIDAALAQQEPTK